MWERAEREDLDCFISLDLNVLLVPMRQLELTELRVETSWLAEWFA